MMALLMHLFVVLMSVTACIFGKNIFRHHITDGIILMENILMRIKLEDTQITTDVCFIFY